ncbi:MAG TPA: TIR domain-containing protein [Kofleriaceae bacterium]|nr:TIR domain-containing protein [Kofleriaceae bacterium]
MTRQQPTATRLEFYLVWLALRRMTRSEGAVAAPLRQAITAFLDRIDALLELDIDEDRRREIAQVQVALRGSQLANGALHGACSRLADLLGLVLSEPGVLLRRPKIDQITYIRLLQLAVHLSEQGDDELSAEQLAARANVALDRVHVAIARMLADGVVHLPIGDDGRADAFRVNEPATPGISRFAPEVELAAPPRRDRRRRDEPVVEAPNPREVVVIHGRGTARTAFFFELLRRLGLRPLAFDELTVGGGAGNPSTREVMQAAIARAQAVLVLFTAEDLAGLGPERPTPPQPHVHVVFEAGVAVALAHARTVLVEVAPISGLLDLADVHAVRFATGSSDERYQLVRRLRAAGCELDTDGSTWLNLEFPPPPSRPP